MTAGRYSKLLGKDKNLSRWYNNLSKGSVIVAENYLRRLGSFCEKNRVAPSDLARLHVRKLEDMTQDFVDRMESESKPGSQEKYAPSYIQTYLKAVKSWAEWNRKPLQRRIRVKDASKTPSLQNERVPTRDELRNFLYNDRTPFRTRASVALIGFSGLRIEVLGNYLGLDGLRVKDLPELSIKDGDGGIKVEFKHIPTIVVVREELSKSRHQYITFLGEEGCSILKEYLERRGAEDDRLAADSPVIATTPSQAARAERFNNRRIEDKSPFLRTTKIGDEIRKAMRAVGLPWRPYIFRSYFDTNVMVAEGKGLVTHAYQQFWMGHKGDIESTYTTRKRQLSEELLEDMREAYGRVSEFLETKADSRTAESYRDLRGLIEAGIVDLQNSRHLAYAAGRLRIPVGHPDVVRMIYDRLGIRYTEIFEEEKPDPKVIGEKELQKYLDNGWSIQTVLPSGKVVVKK